MPLADLIKIIKKNISPKQQNAIAQRADLPQRRRAGA